MPIRFLCVSCQARMKVPDGTHGKRVKCPRCGTTQKVPAAAQPPAEVAVASPPRRDDTHETKPKPSRNAAKAPQASNIPDTRDLPQDTPAPESDDNLDALAALAAAMGGDEPTPEESPPDQTTLAPETSHQDVPVAKAKTSRPKSQEPAPPPPEATPEVPPVPAPEVTEPQPQPESQADDSPVDTTRDEADPFVPGDEPDESGSADEMNDQPDDLARMFDQATASDAGHDDDLRDASDAYSLEEDDQASQEPAEQDDFDARQRQALAAADTDVYVPEDLPTSEPPPTEPMEPEPEPKSAPPVAPVAPPEAIPMAAVPAAAPRKRSKVKSPPYTALNWLTLILRCMAGLVLLPLGHQLFELHKLKVPPVTLAMLALAGLCVPVILWLLAELAKAVRDIARNSYN